VILFLSLLFLLGNVIRLHRRSTSGGSGGTLDLGELEPADSTVIAFLMETSRDLQEDPEGMEAITFPLNVNTATIRQLTALPGIGPVLAERIVAKREERGRFQSIDDLRSVKGIGNERIRNLASYVVVSD
jgi:competence ComEA-like helix-hairpin-helix protein